MNWDQPLDNVPALAGQAVDGRSGFQFNSGAFDGLDLSDAAVANWKVAVLHSDSKSYHSVKSIYHADRLIYFKNPAKSEFGSDLSSSGKRWYIENAKGPALRPGSWRVDGTSL